MTKSKIKQLWFKAKIYGWGWYPVTWQGWLVLLIFLMIHLWNTGRIERNNLDLTVYTLQTIVLIGLLILVCYLKGEKPEWRWGTPKKSSKKN